MKIVVKGKDGQKREVPLQMPPYITGKTVFLEKYEIEDRIASGGFGQIYRAKFLKAENVSLAAKISRREVSDFRRIILEQKVLTKFCGKKHVPRIIASGNYNEFMFIIMRICGPDLARIRKRLPNQRFSVPTVLQFGIQAIEALKDMHDSGYLHRDVKPGNFCIGVENDRRNFYLIDYGMTRRFICENSNLPRPPRKCAGFRGTARYVSITVHDRKEQGPEDDFWSLLYVIIDVGEGTLPWRQREESVTGRMKRKAVIGDMLILLPKNLVKISEHLNSLTTYGQKPDYQLLKEVIMSCFPEGTNINTPMEWEIKPEIIEHLEKTSKN